MKTLEASVDKIASPLRIGRIQGKVGNKLAIRVTLSFVVLKVGDDLTPYNYNHESRTAPVFQRR